MIATCHIYDRETRERICSCPCASASIAKMLATSRHNPNTLALVESPDLYAGYDQGEMFFLVNTAAEFEAEKRKLKLYEKDSRSRITYDRTNTVNRVGLRAPTRPTVSASTVRHS